METNKRKIVITQKSIYDPKRDNWYNPAYDALINVTIKEYDMKAGGFNIMRNENLLPENQLRNLEALYDKLNRYKEEGRKEEIKQLKLKRHVIEGKMMRDNKELRQGVKEGFAKYRKLFLDDNDIRSENIVTVKKDALFIANKHPRKTKYNHVLFRVKNTYSSYYRVGKLEFFYDSLKNKIDVKGINPTDEYKDLFDRHEKYMNKFLCNLFKIMENNREAAMEYLIDFLYKYNNKKLDIEYYREFSSKSMFRLNFVRIAGKDFATDEAADVNLIDISYNYNEILKPLMSLIL